MVTTSERVSSSSKDTDSRSRLCGPLGSQGPAPGQHLHPERRADLGDPAADPAESEHSQGRPGEIAPEGGLPAPGPQRADLVHQMPAVSQDERPGELDRRRRDAVGVADHDPPPGRRRHVDHRVATAGGHDQPQPIEAIDHGAREGRPLAHQHDRLVPRQPLRQGLGVGDVIGEDVDPPLGLQPGPVRQLQGGSGVVIEHRNVHPRHYAPWLRQAAAVTTAPGRSRLGAESLGCGSGLSRVTDRRPR